MLHLSSNSFFDQNQILNLITPYVDTTKRPRLIEVPSKEVRAIQSSIKKMLNKIDVPENIFSGIKGKSYVDNARIHSISNNNYVYKIDLSAFFPSIPRNYVYNFFINDLLCSPDVAFALTNLTTVDLSKITNCDPSVYDFLKNKNITCINHLISGAPTSQILSYLANHRMFDDIQKLSNRYGITMSIYVDDITFSSNEKIPKRFKESIKSIIIRYGYKLSKGKEKYYIKNYPKLVTGVIIGTHGDLLIKNELRLKVIKEFKRLQKDPNNDECRKRLRGLVLAARQVDTNAFQSIYQYVNDVHK